MTLPDQQQPDLTLLVHAFDSFAVRKDDEPLKQCWLQDVRLEIKMDWQGYLGYCPLCEAILAFDHAPAGEPRPLSTREDLICPGCSLNSRVRATFAMLLRECQLGPDSVTYLTEQATRAFVWAQDHLPGRVIGSEFQPDPDERGKLTEWLHALGGSGEVEFNDVTDLGFESGGIDAILSMDVLEHVPDYRRALSEFARVLRPGGCLLATFPFCDAPQTIVRARLRGGEIEHLLEPEYHGDPIGGGVLCWYHFGWDLLDACREAGFANARMLMPWSRQYGFQYGLWTLVAENGDGSGAERVKA